MKTIISILIISLGLAFEGKSQAPLTIGQIYDYNINDEFHYYYYGIPPNATRFKIINKYFSALNDTVTYIRHFDNYFTQVNMVPTPHFDYFFDVYTDTIRYTNLTTIFDSAYINWPSVDTGDWFNDTLFYSTQMCGRLIYDYTACLNCIFEGHYYHNQYGQGLGLVTAIHQCPAWPQTNDQYYLKYYKKDTIECGIADTTDSSAITTAIELEKYFNSFSLYPNPASTEIRVDTRPFEVFNISIFNSTGILVRRIDNVISGQPIDISYLSKGFYFATIESDKKIYQKKIIIE